MPIPPLVPNTAPAPATTFDRIVRLASKFLGTPVSLMSLVGPEKQVFVSAIGLDEPWATQMETPLSHSLCQYVVAEDAPLRLSDARLHLEHRTNLSIPELGVVSYLGVPLRTGTQKTLGALCVIGHEPRDWTDAEVQTLEDLSGIATTEIERQQAQTRLARASNDAARQAAMIRAFFDTAPVMMGVVELLPDDILHRLDNSASAGFVGTTPEAMKGQRTSALGADPDTVSYWLKAFRATVKSQTPVQFDHIDERAQGRKIFASTVNRVGVSAVGRPLCSYVSQDVTDQRATEAALRKSEQDLQLALRAGKMGAWKVDLLQDDVTFSDAMNRLCQIERSEHALSDASAIVHELDQERVRQVFASAVEATVSTGDPQEVVIEYRVHVEGEVRWFRTVGQVHPGEPGTARSIAGTSLDVTVEKLYQQALEQAREQAQEAARVADEASRLKESILHNMSHEIRTPLTAVIGYADLLAAEATDDASEFVGYIRSASEQLLSTLNSVLDHARMEAGHGATNDGEEIVTTRLNLSPLVSATAQLFKHRAADKGVALEWSPPPDPIWAMGDHGAIQRVLANLTSNAVKFTDSGSITLAIDRQPRLASSTEAASGAEDVVITVRDTGIGMSEGFVTNAFEPFHQESDGMARSHEGTGLGLSIVRRLVEMMSGTITLTSAHGVGTVFEVRLPAAAVAQDVAA